MDWLERMNGVVCYIEDHLDEQIDFGVFGRILCCSTYEFSRVFSFMTGMPVSEYIRRRRLSRAVFDIQGGRGRILDVALKYGYESQAAFTRAFAAMHGVSPSAARKMGETLRTYPKLSFSLTIKGVNAMDFRMEKMEEFRIAGRLCDGGYDKWCDFDVNGIPRLEAANMLHAPLWYVGAYFRKRPDEAACIIGGELTGSAAPEGMDIEVIAPATWAVFPFAFRPGEDAAGETYARVVSEWLPESNYLRDENLPYLEIYGHWARPKRFEIWIPVVEK